MTIERNGRKCTCGNNGCIETYASMRALKEQIAKQMNAETITGQELYEVIKNGDKNIQKIVENFLKFLNIAFTNYINIFEPEAICLGGSFVYFKDLLLDRLLDKMQKENKTFNKSLPEIVVAKMRK